MKFRALIAAALTLAIVASFTLTPAAPALALLPGDARIAGTVTAAVSGAPLPNVCVVNGPVAIRCWTITNSEGKYELIVPGLTGVTYQTNIQFFLPGYISQSHNVTITGGSDIPLNVALVQTNPGPPPPTTTPPPFIGNPPPPEPPKPTFTVYLPNIVR